MEKRCTKCGQIKPLSEFNKNKTRVDGHREMCKNCRSQYEKRLKDSNPEKVRERYNKYNQSQKGRNKFKEWINQNKDKIAEIGRRFRRTTKGKVSINKHEQRYSAKYPEKRFAKTEVYKAVAAGKLPRVNTLTCHRCHVNQAKHYHHPDYSKPLDVIPLCVQCHIDILNQS
jgi:hypothetical protein